MKKIINYFASVKESLDSIMRTCYRIQFLLESINSRVESVNIVES